MIDVARRLKDAVEAWPPALRDEFIRYTSTPPAAGRQPDAEPYWLLFPAWLAEKINSESAARPIGDTFLDDILWGQYCLFLAIRIQDDLYDGQAQERALIYASDQFFFEADARYTRHMGAHAPFWDLYHHFREETTRGIIAADELQKTLQGNPEMLLAEYIRVAAIFKIAMAAVCFRGNREADFVPLAATADHLAAAGQMEDDFCDLIEDLNRGRINYAAQVILQRPTFPPPSSAGLVDLVAHNLVYTDGVTTLFSAIEHHWNLATTLMMPLNLPSVRANVETARQGLEAMRMKFHAQRMRLIFGDLADQVIARNRPGNT
jgi:hypothetical protein